MKTSFFERVTEIYLAPGYKLMNWKAQAVKLMEVRYLDDPASLLAWWQHDGVVVRAFGLYLCSTRFESLSSPHFWALSKPFIPSLVVV